MEDIETGGQIADIEDEIRLIRDREALTREWVRDWPRIWK
jgi:hypothetical protein